MKGAVVDTPVSLHCAKFSATMLTHILVIYLVIVGDTQAAANLWLYFYVM